MFLVTWVDDQEQEQFQECNNKAEAEDFVYGFLRQQPIILDSVKVHNVSSSYHVNTELEQ